jgi:lipopolysaccharide/colanic/teichoic acid biosynthesis glycosyltransferase
LQESSQDLLLVGRLLKKYYLDELDQVINFVRDNMSMVGPRPHAIGEPIPHEVPRRELKSGIFCFVANRWKAGKMTWLTHTSDDKYLTLYKQSSVFGILWLDFRVLLDGMRAIGKGKGQ